MVPAEVTSQTRAQGPAPATQLDQLELAGLPEPKEAPPEPDAGEKEASFQGPAPRLVTESRLRLDRSSPKALLQGALSALAARDLPALARLSRSTRTHPRLSEDDAADARRQFLGPAVRSYWHRVQRALRSGSYAVDERAGSAVVRLQVGGAAGGYRIALRKEGGEWYLDG